MLIWSAEQRFTTEPPPPMFKGTMNGRRLPSGLGTGVLTVRLVDARTGEPRLTAMYLATTFAAAAELPVEAVPDRVAWLVDIGFFRPLPDGSYATTGERVGNP